MENNTVPKPTYMVEGVGSAQFNNIYLLATLIGAPLAINLALPISFAWYPIFLVLGFFPTFAAFNYFWAIFIESKSKLSASKLPGRNIEEYMTIIDPELKSLYSGRNKIPMETFFEAYFDGKIDLKNPEDILGFLEHRYDWASMRFTWSQAKFLVTQWIPELLVHSRKQDEDQVRDHYDRGDDFYEAFLGPMMIYTSGIITDRAGTENLEELQTNKLKLVCEKIQLKENERMLDIGCGWGTLSSFAAKENGAKVTGVTLGRNQAQWGMKTAEKYGVADKVRILCMDYRDIPNEKYDKITCLEMAEHVGVRKFQDFLIQVREMLEDDGIFFLQIAGLRRAWQYEDLSWGLFMAKYIFPGADASCPLNWVLEQMERAGFEIHSVDTIGVHYSATIHRWYLNWMKNRADMQIKYGKRWVRIWEIFLAWSTIIARQGSATCYQIVSHKNRNALDRTRYVSKRLLA